MKGLKHLAVFGWTPRIRLDALFVGALLSLFIASGIRYVGEGRERSPDAYVEVLVDAGDVDTTIASYRAAGWDVLGRTPLAPPVVPSDPSLTRHWEWQSGGYAVVSSSRPGADRVALLDPTVGLGDSEVGLVLLRFRRGAPGR